MGHEVLALKKHNNRANSDGRKLRWLREAFDMKEG